MFINILYTLAFSCLFIAILVFSNINASVKSTKILSPIAITQTGKVAIDNKEDLTLDKELNLKLNEFTGYVNPRNSTYQILLGPIFGKDKLEEICQHPDFLLSEHITQTLPIAKQKYLKKPFQACLIELDSKRTAMVIKLPRQFTDQQGREVKFVGIVSDTSQVDKILSNISFSISAKDFYLNLLQIGNTFSPFTQQINWQEIKHKGLTDIGNNKEICRGLYAAGQYYLPKLNELDNHSFITLNGLGTEECPKPTIPLDKGMQKWQAVPTETRKRLINYTQNFHGKTYGKITYIYIPAIEAYSQEKIDEAVKKGREELNKANIKNSSGIIVDLRLNTGGDVKSMLLTLGGILPEGKVFGLDPKTFVVLSEKGNRLSIGNETYGNYSGEKPTLARNKPVAILTNWITASSAEITALSLRRNTKQSKIFGSDTSGSLSTNQTFFLWDNNTLNLMFERIYDSHGNTAPLNLPVDNKMPDDLDHSFTDDDQTINAAISWIQSSLGKK